MSRQAQRCVFGPVPSRRLGRSLGVDLVPFKTCSHDCVYCQLGKTTFRTLERREFVPLNRVVEQLREALSTGDRPDSVTLAGSGEPTLYSRLGEVIAAIKDLTDVPVTILTNGSLFENPDVRRDCTLAERVVPSLDAGSEDAFQRINRPTEGLTLAGHVEGLVAFRSEYTGQLWLEVMVVEGMNASDDEIARMALLAERIKPDRIQLNTVIRPPTVKTAHAVNPERMAEICRAFGPNAEVIADYTAKHVTPGVARRREEVLAMIERRPCTLDDVADGLGIHRNEALKYIGELARAERIVVRQQAGRDFYEVCSRPLPSDEDA